MIICEICGNERDEGGTVCPYCGLRDEIGSIKSRKKSFRHKTINLELGRPTVEAALERMVEILRDAKKSDVTMVTLIHGYGSSGKGGVIRVECRKMLDYLKIKGRVSEYIAGEEFNQRSANVKALLRRYPKLRTNRNLNSGNRGITVVVL